MNLNDEVWIKLRPSGKDILYKKWNKYQEISWGQIQKHHGFKKGWYRFQMWDLMKTFGEHLQMGFDLPLETEISLTDPNKKETE